MYHDSLLIKALVRLPGPKPHPSPHNRYTRYWTQKSPTYHRLALILQMIQHTQLLWEMVAKRRSDTTRWRVVVGLEIVKALCRLLLLRLTNSRPLLSPPLPEREVDPSKLEEKANGPDTVNESDSLLFPAESSSTASSDDASWTMPRTGLSLPSLPDSSDKIGRAHV